MTSAGPGRVLSIVVCAAGPAVAAVTFIKLAIDRGWTVQVISTPSALPFFDQGAIEDLTGNPVRSQYSPPGSPRSRIPDAIIVAPATYNTINKWALGIADTCHALGVLAEQARSLACQSLSSPSSTWRWQVARPSRKSVESLQRRGRGASCLAPEPLSRTSPIRAGSHIDSYPWHLATR